MIDTKENTILEKEYFDDLNKIKEKHGEINILKDYQLI